MKPIPCRIALLAGLALATPAGAQTLTDSELTARFIAQREAIQAVGSNPALGAARGLVLTPVAPSQEAGTGAPAALDTLAPPAALDTLAPPAPAGATATLAPPGPAAAPGASTPGQLAAPAGTEAAPLSTATYVKLPQGQDVFVQITFAFDSSVLSEDQKPKLRQICSVLDAANVGVLRIVGHTDAKGPARYNQNLSMLRAEEVQRFFVTECNIAADRLQAIGVGEQFPYDDADPFADGNRRVEFQAIS